jgi:putative sterol carrier protein
VTEGTDKFTTRELNKRTWDDYIKFFSQGNGWDHCGCTAYQGFQAPSEVRIWADKRDWNLEVKRKLLERGLAHGILVYFEGEPVGWCQFGRRGELPIPTEQRKALLNGAPGWKRMRSAVGEGESASERVWRITCFCTRKDFAERDVAGTALRAAVDAIRNRGGGLVEGYPRALAHDYEAGPGRSWRRHGGPFKVPVEGMGEVDGSGWLYGAMHCGTVGMFQRAGFTAVQPIGTGPRVLMRMKVPARRPVTSTSERPRRQGVTHVPYPSELRARAAAMLRAGQDAESVARDLAIGRHLPQRFLVEEEVRWAMAGYPYLRFVHTREDVIDRVETEFARLDRLMSSLSEDDFAVPLLFSDDAIETWTVQDGLVHLTGCKQYEGLVIGRQRPKPAEREPLSPPLGGPASTSWPRQYPTHMRSTPPKPHDVLEWHWQVHADYMRAVKGRYDAEPKLVAVWRWPQQATFHACGHRKQMERALLAAGRSIPLDNAPTAQQLVDQLCGSFNGEMDPNLSVRIQLDIMGKGGGRWWMRINHGECTTGKGDAPRPDVTVSTRVQEFIRLRLGESNPIVSAVRGTIKFTGPMRLGDALRVLSLLKPHYRWPNL